MEHEFILCLVAALLVIYVEADDTEAAAECIKGPSTWYRGDRSYTSDGKTCQRWDTNRPHWPKYIPKDGGHHNHCRNPNGDIRGTWCYTTDSSIRWQYCRIQKCRDDSMVVWTNYDATSESTYFLRAPANPSIVKSQTDSTGSFNVTLLSGSLQSFGEYWALAASYSEKKFYFTDYRYEYIGVWDMEQKKASRYFEGIARGIECIAYDWKTRNLYWTDSEYKWVMAAEHSFSYFTPVYRTSPDPTYGLAVHSMKRLLIFSTYKPLGSKIIVTDLAGKNEKILFRFPSVFDVTGITIDYTDDRLYWTDFTGYGGMVMSSLLDGTNKTQHQYKELSIFRGVAAYMDYIYLTDIYARKSWTGSRFYSAWIINKRSKQSFRYTSRGKPRGIAVYSANEEFSMDDGECHEGEKCGHLCLPRINAPPVCACSLGYYLDGSNNCVTKLVEDDYLLVADDGQGRVFQIPIEERSQANGALDYSTVPLDHKWKIVTIALNPINQYLYWSEKREPSVNRAAMDGSKQVKIVNSYANSIVIDPHTGNLFYSDSDTDTIMVSNANGTKRRTIVKSDKRMSNTTSIRMIAQDIKYKYIYWTNTFSEEWKGKVMRCRFDGGNKEVVLDKLNWPHAITIDYSTNLLYVAEAKTAIIYELELSSLVKINNTSPNQKHYKQYDISAYITRISPYIIDIKVHNGMVYVVDGKGSMLKRFNLAFGAPSMTPYGPAEFFRITALSVYSNSFYDDYIKSNKNPCAVSHCRSICVAVSDTTYNCLCEDGKKLFGQLCVDLVTVDTNPPTHINCQEDRIITLGACSATATFTWNEPLWADDETAEEELVISRPLLTSPAKLAGAQRHEFKYTATDKSGNVGYCTFTITVLDNQCPPVPNLRPGLVRSDSSCENRQGSYFNVTCIDARDVIWINGSPSTSTKGFQVHCSSALSWVSIIPNRIECRPPPPTNGNSITKTVTPRPVSQPWQVSHPLIPHQQQKPQRQQPTKKPAKLRPRIKLLAVLLSNQQKKPVTAMKQVPRISTNKLENGVPP